MRRDLRQDLPPLSAGPSPGDLRAARRRLATDMVGIVLSAAGFGVVYGLAAAAAGFSPFEASAMSVVVFAGASQFAAVGMVAAALPWSAIVVTTALINARHLLYGAALRPWLASRPLAERAVMAHLLTDEAFALSLVHFRRLGRADVGGYWLAAIGSTFIPWNVATLAGVLGGQVIPDPRTLGLDLVFPAAMAGLAVALVSGRRELVTVGAGAAIAVALGLAIDPRTGVVAGGLLGPLVAIVAPFPERPSVLPQEAVEMGHPHLAEPLEAGSAEGDGR